MLDPLSQSRAVRLSNWITASNGSANLLGIVHHQPKDWPAWYRQLITKLGVIDKSDSITYLSSTVTKDNPAGGTVFALTDNLAVKANVLASRPPDNGEVELLIWSRAKLEQVRLLQADDYAVFEVEEATTLPQFVELELFYAGQPPLKLPLAARAGLSAEHELTAIFARLLDDVCR